MPQHGLQDVLRRHQQLCMSERLVVETQIGGSFFFRLFEADRAGADRDAITIFQLVLEFLFAVDKDLIGAALHLAVHKDAVDEREGSVIARFDVRVMARSARIVEHHLVIGSAPDHDDSIIKWMLCLASAGVGDFQYGHRN